VIKSEACVKLDQREHNSIQAFRHSFKAFRRCGKVRQHLVLFSGNNGYSRNLRRFGKNSLDTLNISFGAPWKKKTGFE